MNNLLKFFLISITVTFAFSLRLFVYADHDKDGPKGPYIIYNGTSRKFNPIYDVDFKKMEDNEGKYKIALELCKKSNEYLVTKKNITAQAIEDSIKISSQIQNEFRIVDPELTTNFKLCSEVRRFLPRSTYGIVAGNTLVEKYYPFCTTIISFSKCYQNLETRFTSKLKWLVNTKHKNLDNAIIPDLLANLKNLNSKMQEIKALPKATTDTDI